MEILEFILQNKNYVLVDKYPSDRMSDIARFLDSDISDLDGKMCEYLQELFSAKADNFSTSLSNVERVDDNHVKIHFLYTDFDKWDETGTVIDKEQLYYLMNEWVRLVQVKAKKITVTYDNDIYTIEGGG